MRILQILHSFLPHNLAGTEIYTYNLSCALAKRHSIFVFYRISDLKKREYELNYKEFNGLDIFTINNTFRFCDSFEKFYKNNVITAQFAQILDKIKPDIVHIQHLIFLSTTIIAEIKKRKIPIVFTLHDYWLICPQWHFLKKDLTLCNNNDVLQCIECLNYQLSIKKWPKKIYLDLRNILPAFLIRSLKGTYLKLAMPNLDFQESLAKIEARIKHIKELCALVDIFIAPSQFLRSRFIEFGISEDKIKFIPHGINTEIFKDFKRKESNRIRFGFVGTILPAKGLDILIKAFNRIEDNQAALKIYGKLFPYQGFEYYPKYIKRLARNNNIRFMGEFGYGNAEKVFSEIDILVAPSIWNENFPLVIQEAQLAGIPVVASCIGGIPELIRDGENGLLFQPNDVDALYFKLKTLIKKPGLIEHLKDNITPPKDIETNAEEIEDIYEHLLS